MAERKRMSLDQMTYAREHMEDKGQRRPEAVDLSSVRGVKYWSPKVGSNTINIVPFFIATNNHPLVRAKKAKIGDLSWCLDIWVHNKIGENEETVLCLKKTYGQKCCICDRVGELYDVAGPKGVNDKSAYSQAGDLKASRRTYLNVEPFLKGEPQDLSVFHASHFLFTQELIAEATACEDGAEIVNFSDPVEGTLVKFRGEELEDFNKAIECKAFKFPERSEELAEGLEEKAIPFDKYLKVLTPDQVRELMYGGPVGGQEDDGDQPPAKPSRGQRVAAAVEDDDPPPRPRARPAAAAVEDDDDPPPRPRPSRSAAQESAVAAPPAPEAPAPQPKAQTAAAPVQSDSRCPSGHGFGLSCYGSFPECKTCPVENDCMMED